MDHVFDMLDADKDGHISRDEFRNAPMPGRAGPDGPGNPGDPGQSVFRVLRYAPDYPAFHGKNLIPGPMLDEALRREAPPMIRPGPRPGRN
jgi:hypothetical protein